MRRLASSGSRRRFVSDSPSLTTEPRLQPPHRLEAEVEAAEIEEQERARRDLCVPATRIICHCCPGATNRATTGHRLRVRTRARAAAVEEQFWRGIDRKADADVDAYRLRDYLAVKHV
jgi:hypothetical protein